MSIDLAYDDAQEAIRDAIAQFCRDRCDDDTVKASAGRHPEALWRELAELGVLSAGIEGEGGALELCAAMEALGHAIFPGPIFTTVLAGQVLNGRERDALVEGELIVSAGCPPLLPWATLAGCFLEIDGDEVYRAEPAGKVEPVETLGGEPWGRVELERGEELAGGSAGLVLCEIALAAYLAAAGMRLIGDACEHARSRSQFGRAIGEFQAVAHPLADCHMQLSAAAALARAAAFAVDTTSAVEARAAAAAARLSAGRGAVEAAYVGHQVFGAIGITIEGPAFHISRRIRQLASYPPGDASAREAVLASIGLGREGESS